jgi:aryl-alcohol dehydrogenase-like predicted oxidoreductase
LGAAQFNSKYGVTNFNRKNMKRSETNKILNYLSTKSSINELDSATNYKIDQKNLDLLKKNIYLNTKILTTEKISYSKLKIFFDQANTNQKIKINTIFIHDGDNVLTKKGIELLNKLKKLKKDKKIMKVGLSIHKYENLLNIINKVSFDVIQLPYNFVDRRAEVYFSKLKDKNIEIQVRSIFLQGSLLTKVSTNKKLSLIFEKFNRLSQNKHINRLRYILSFILRSRYIDKIIIGIRDLKEFKQINNINFFYNSVNALNKLKSSDQKIINPLEWKELVLDEKKPIKSI